MLYYFDSYYISSSHELDVKQGSAKVTSQTYVDFSAGYRFQERAGSQRYLGRGEIRFGIRNLFNHAPPIEATALGGFGYSTLGDARLASYYITYRRYF